VDELYPEIAPHLWPFFHSEYPPDEARHPIRAATVIAAAQLILAGFLSDRRTAGVQRDALAGLGQKTSAPRRFRAEICKSGKNCTRSVFLHSSAYQWFAQSASKNSVFPPKNSRRQNRLRGLRPYNFPSVRRFSGSARSEKPEKVKMRATAEAEKSRDPTPQRGSLSLTRCLDR